MLSLNRYALCWLMYNIARACVGATGIWISERKGIGGVSSKVLNEMEGDWFGAKFRK